MPVSPATHSSSYIVSRRNSVSCRKSFPCSCYARTVTSWLRNSCWQRACAATVVVDAVALWLHDWCCSIVRRFPLWTRRWQFVAAITRWFNARNTAFDRLTGCKFDAFSGYGTLLTAVQLCCIDDWDYSRGPVLFSVTKFSVSGVCRVPPMKCMLLTMHCDTSRDWCAKPSRYVEAYYRPLATLHLPPAKMRGWSYSLSCPRVLFNFFPTGGNLRLRLKLC